MSQIIIYAVAFLTVLASLLHTLLTDPAAATVLTPGLKSTLALVAVGVTMALDSLPKLLAALAPATPKDTGKS